MAGRGQAFIVDQHPEKQKIIDGILSGQSVRAIARSVNPPIEFNAIQRYKARVVRPILGRAEETERLLGELKATPPATLPPQPSPVALQKAATAIQDGPKLSIFRGRLEKLWRTTDETIDEARAAVKVVPGEDGNPKPVGRDIAVMAPLLNAAHKNLEMLGRATGELEPQDRGPGISVQIVCPWTGPDPANLPRVSYSAPDAIEDESDEVLIGILQA
jgi:hypothetical protein